MKILIPFSFCAGICACAVAMAQSVGTPRVESGRWEVAVSLRGGPIKDPAPSTVCLHEQDLNGMPERPLLDAALRSLPMESKGEPKCVLTDLARDNEKSKWLARCNGPRGPMQGNGQGTVSSQSVTMEQEFGIDTPLGRKQLSQTIRARRLGSCS
jgi:hypothetical protein